MAIRQVFSVSRKTFFNPSAWFNFSAFKAQNKTIRDVLTGMVTVPTPEREETFEAAMERQGLSEVDIHTAENSYRWYARGFLVLGTLVFFFAFYLLFRYGTFQGWLLAIAASTLLFGQVFKYDFWAFQIKKRQLGCTFAEWKHSRLSGQG